MLVPYAVEGLGFILVLVSVAAAVGIVITRCMEGYSDGTMVLYIGH